jgi:hypothetical protein
MNSDKITQKVIKILCVFKYTIRTFDPSMAATLNIQFVSNHIPRQIMHLTLYFGSIILNAEQTVTLSTYRDLRIKTW